MGVLACAPGRIRTCATASGVRVETRWLRWLTSVATASPGALRWLAAVALGVFSWGVYPMCTREDQQARRFELPGIGDIGSTRWLVSFVRDIRSDGKSPAQTEVFWSAERSSVAYDALGAARYVQIVLASELGRLTPSADRPDRRQAVQARHVRGLLQRGIAFVGGNTLAGVVLGCRDSQLRLVLDAVDECSPTPAGDGTSTSASMNVCSHITVTCPRRSMMRTSLPGASATGLLEPCGGVGPPRRPARTSPGRVRGPAGWAVTTAPLQAATAD